MEQMEIMNMWKLPTNALITLQRIAIRTNYQLKPETLKLIEANKG